jgi:hypothetical protein
MSHDAYVCMCGHQRHQHLKAMYRQRGSCRIPGCRCLSFEAPRGDLLDLPLFDEGGESG